MTSYNLMIDLDLVSLTPVAVVTPDARDVKINGASYKETFRRHIYRDGTRLVVPGVPGSTLRGRLRRSATEVARRIVDRKLTLDEFHQSAVGGVKGAGSEDAYDIVGRAAIRAKNPVLGLFGAGDPWMRGACNITDALPDEEIECEIIRGVRSDDGRRDQEFFSRLTDDAPDCWLGLVGANRQRGEMKKREAELKREISAAMRASDKALADKLKQERAASEKDKSGSSIAKTNPVGMPITHEAVPAGVKFRASLRASRSTPSEIWLLLAALDHMWRETPQLGGHTALGYGLLEADASFRFSAVSEDILGTGGDAGEGSTGSFRLVPDEGLVPGEGVPALIEDMRSGVDFATWDLGLASEIMKAGKQAKGE